MVLQGSLEGQGERVPLAQSLVLVTRGCVRPVLHHSIQPPAGLRLNQDSSDQVHRANFRIDGERGSRSEERASQVSIGQLLALGHLRKAGGSEEF